MICENPATLIVGGHFLVTLVICPLSTGIDNPRSPEVSSSSPPEIAPSAVVLKVRLNDTRRSPNRVGLKVRVISRTTVRFERVLMSPLIAGPLKPFELRVSLPSHHAYMP